MIPLHKPYLTGKEKANINEVLESGHISGNGKYTRLCQKFFEDRYHFSRCLLTSSCTDALEMCALLLDIGPDDEVIIPSYTFVSTANAFAIFGAKIVFCDSLQESPNIDPQEILKLITPKTKAIVIVHYAGISCDMEAILKIANEYNIKIIEDAALALDSYYKGKPLGSFGDFATFSFHETKNITCGEGGLLVINNTEFIEKSEIIWEKGTNRSAFLKGLANQYEWISKGSSYLPSEITASILYAQLENLNIIQSKRVQDWNNYNSVLSSFECHLFKTPVLKKDDAINGSIYYIIFQENKIAKEFIDYMNMNDIYVSNHYLPLHNSYFYKNNFTSEKLINCEKFRDSLVRLPMFYDQTKEEFETIINTIETFIINKK